jgi:preprotein translocase subunit SecA
MRDIRPDERIAEEVKQAVIDIVMHHGMPIGRSAPPAPPAADGTAPPSSGSAGPEPASNGRAGTNGAEKKGPPKTIDELEEIYSMASLQQDVYQFWGYRLDYKDGDSKKPKAIYERLAAEIPLSLTEQREQLLDLLDAIVGAIVEECCPANKPPEDWDWKGIKSGFIEHFASKAPDVEHLHDPEQVAKALFAAAEKKALEKEKEMGTELLLRVFRHFYLEEIDRQWVEHLTSMEHLRDGIGLRGYGQRDPKQEYKKEGYDVFVTMMASTSSSVCSKLF